MFFTVMMGLMVLSVGLRAGKTNASHPGLYPQPDLSAVPGCSQGAASPDRNQVTSRMVGDSLGGPFVTLKTRGEGVDHLSYFHS